MHTWLEAACEKVVSSDMYSITHNLRGPADPAESNSKCEEKDQITVVLTIFSLGFPRF